MAERTPRMISLGFGKWARADRIYALEPLEGSERGHGRRTRVWVMPVPLLRVGKSSWRSKLLLVGGALKTLGCQRHIR